MQSGDKDNKPFLLPGALFAKNGDYIITTVLGSCISVCLWDRSTKRGGMNHYKLPLWNGDGLPSPKFGNIAIEKLIENLLEIGCQQRNLIAKVFGGAAVIQSSSGLLNVGERNIEVARDYLAQARIPIAASDVGGTQSRKVIFNTADGSILMKKAAPQ
ncbi:MAG: chemotaxis protein CheD [Magnetococcales bacterium]|nr:chemotaxis protein CheD [Magnetococcales bacterium]MBF0150264.1 chemotaxis protein CheD [Magnetococcales bacterium]MBF0172154.1 chemotaxis protein CheD [Magnetococcales bacterium]MBF0347954.1 chemotaxis protein CheD [Magnetococcales bacterium]MBF0630546.1 chemotaxis protein CheD [Magnetococcales bacterium]